MRSGDTISRISLGSERQRRVDKRNGPVALFVVVAIVALFVTYVVSNDGAARVSAIFAGVLVCLGVWLIVWGYRRRPSSGQGDDFLDKFLAGVGQALLLGAVLSFGFGIVGQQLEDEQKARDEERADEQKAADEQRAAEQAVVDLRRDLAGQVRADAGGRHFPAVDLGEQSFVGLNLSGFSFAEANLSGADLSFADLTRSLLVHADLTGADLISANLTGAWVTGADLTGANLTGANLTGVILTGAILTDADLTGVFYDANTMWPDGFEPPPTTEFVED